MSRPQILEAKLDKMASVVADADDLKSMPKDSRPNSASVNDVRGAYRDAMLDLNDNMASVIDVESVKLPSERL